MAIKTILDLLNGCEVYHIEIEGYAIVKNGLFLQNGEILQVNNDCIREVYKEYIKNELY